jgi:glycosyltransferase involved in cell wall biosynthesis
VEIGGEFTRAVRAAKGGLLLRKPGSTVSNSKASNCWIIVPAYNEHSLIGKVLGELVELGRQIVVVDDGSTDSTWLEASKHPVHILRHAVNLGQGAALQTGIFFALREGAEYLITFDSDGQHSPGDIAALLGPLTAGEVQVTLGTRFGGQMRNDQTPRMRRLVLRVAAWAARKRTGLRITDTHNGLRGFTAEAARQIEITHNGMAHASEILEIIAHKEFTYKEVDVSIEYSPYSLKKGQKLSNSFNILWDQFFGKVR